MIVVGIDPGKDGGYVELDEAGAVLWRGRLYQDHALPRLELIQWERAHIFMERAQVMNREGRPTSSVSMFSYGQAFGEILGRIAILRIPLTLVRPADWSRMMHSGTKAGDTKKRSLEAAQRIFPHETWLPTEACKKPHDGIYEAALIAEWGRRQLQGGRATIDAHQPLEDDA